jgi:hypothetical protein
VEDEPGGERVARLEEPHEHEIRRVERAGHVEAEERLPRELVRVPERQAPVVERPVDERRRRVEVPEDVRVQEDHEPARPVHVDPVHPDRGGKDGQAEERREDARAA